MGPQRTVLNLLGSEAPQWSTSRAFAAGNRTSSPFPCQPNQGQMPMAPCLHLWWVGGKSTGLGGQRPVQLVRSKDTCYEPLERFIGIMEPRQNNGGQQRHYPFRHPKWRYPYQKGLSMPQPTPYLMTSLLHPATAT